MAQILPWVIFTTFIIMVLLILIGVFISVRLIRRYDKEPELSLENVTIDPANTLNDHEIKERVARTSVSLVLKKIMFRNKWIEIPIPRWMGWGFFEDKELLDTVAYKFLDHYKDELSGVELCALSFAAHKFLVELQPELDELGARIVLAPSSSLSKDRRLILFDMSVNTGQTMAEAFQYYTKHQVSKPQGMWTLLFNDFLPKKYRSKWESVIYDQFITRSREKTNYLFLATDIIPDFSQSVSKALKHMLSLLEKQPIRSNEVDEARETLEKRWIEEKLPTLERTLLEAPLIKER